VTSSLRSSRSFPARCRWFFVTKLFSLTIECFCFCQEEALFFSVSGSLVFAK